MVLTHIDLKYVSLIYRKIRQKVPNGKGLNCRFITSPFCLILPSITSIEWLAVRESIAYHQHQQTFDILKENHIMFLCLAYCLNY